MTRSLRPDVSLTDTDAGLVLLDERAGTYFQLNSTGAFVLHQLLDGTAPAAVATLLGRRYAVTEERATADVAALLDRLRVAGLLVEDRS